MKNWTRCLVPAVLLSTAAMFTPLAHAQAPTLSRAAGGRLSTISETSALSSSSETQGTGVVSSVVPVGTECAKSTAARGGGPDNWEIVRGGTYTVTITGVTECSGNAITVFMQSSEAGNFCFNAYGGSGTYTGSVTIPATACNTMPISYICGESQPCKNLNNFIARGPSGASRVHFRVSRFDANCQWLGSDSECNAACTTPPTLSGCTPNLVDLGCNPAQLPACGDRVVTALDCKGNEVSVNCRAGEISRDGCARMQTFTYSATGEGGTASCEVTYRWTVVSAPVFDNCTSDITDLGCNPASLPACDPTVSARNECGPVQVTCSVGAVQIDGCKRTMDIVYTATACELSSSCTRRFTWFEDKAAPSITCPADITVHVGEECCLNVDPGMPTATDDCGTPAVRNDAPAKFCLGTTIVKWTAEDGCHNTATCEQKVTVLGQICATKFYDTNANGVRDNGEPGVENWKITLSDGQIGYTGPDGTVCFNVPAGAYTVTENMLENWQASTPTSVSVTIDADHCSAAVSFGNYCYNAPTGGLTLGFWSNKNGQSILQKNDPAWRVLLNGLNLKNANGTDFDVTTSGSFATAYGQLRAWLLNATATNMAYMLSAQLTASTLASHYASLNPDENLIVLGGSKSSGNVCLVSFLSVPQPITCGGSALLALNGMAVDPACGCAPNNATVSLADLQARANCLLGSYSNTVSASTERTYEDCVKELLDMVNNNGKLQSSSSGVCGGIIGVINPPGVCPVEAPMPSGALDDSTDGTAVQGGAVAQAPHNPNLQLSAAPNPFHATTRVAYSVGGSGGRVQIAIYDVVGRRVWNLVDEFQVAGPHEAIWDGRSDQGKRVEAGVYFVRALVGKERKVVTVLRMQ